MKKLTPDQIRDEFNARKEKFAVWGEETGLNSALQGMSAALADLRAGGIDVSLEIFGDASEQAFSLRPDTSVTTPISGVLRINKHPPPVFDHGQRKRQPLPQNIPLGF